MVDATTLTYAVGTVGMLVGVAIAARLVSVADHRDGKFGYLLVIPGFAALMYALMAAGVGTTTFQGYTVPIARYVDWLVTTPILVGYTVYVAGVNTELDGEWIVGVAVADALMIALGGVAVATAPPLRWIAFALSSLAHLALLGVLYGVVPGCLDEQSSKRRRLGKVLQNHVGLLWIAYPLLWVAGPGLELVSATALSLMITYLDVVAKVPFVYFVYRSRDAFAGASATGASVEAPGESPAASAD